MMNKRTKTKGGKCSMKKAVLFLAALTLMLCAACFALAEEDHEHDWVLNHDSEYHWGFCTICGATSEKQEHVLLCVSPPPYSCVICGAKQSDGAVFTVKTHYPVLTVDVAFHNIQCSLCATVLSYGRHRTDCLHPDVCQECGATVEEFGIEPYIEHDYAVDCKDENYHWIECSRCGDVYENRKEPHYVPCTAEDKTVCAHCGASAAEGANLGELVHGTLFTNFDTYTHWTECPKCGETWNTEKHVGSCLYPETCQGCGSRVEEDGIVIDHQEHLKSMIHIPTPTEHYRICGYCGQEFDRGPHYALCTEPGVCAVCGAEWAGEPIHEIAPDEGYIPVDDLRHEYKCVHCGNMIREKHVFENGVCTACGEKQQPASGSPRYTVEGFSYDGDYITGRLTHTPGTPEAERLFVRITLFLADGSTSVTINLVDDDAAFEAGASGAIVHISLAVTATSKSVRADGSWKSLGSYEY